MRKVEQERKKLLHLLDAPTIFSPFLNFHGEQQYVVVLRHLDIWDQH